MAQCLVHLGGTTLYMGQKCEHMKPIGSWRACQGVTSLAPGWVTAQAAHSQLSSAIERASLLDGKRCCSFGLSREEASPFRGPSGDKERVHVVTRTLHPLPFEHLDPKRFEDLVRQLVYDFRAWRQLEATGRSGSDSGFDARGREGGNEAPPPSDEELEEADDVATLPEPRVWLIQCKRERRIGPAKLVAHLEAIPRESLSGLYGLLFVASCDFSKATRDACREWCRERGLQEVHVWGRAEIEDQLYQPKNDHLLFAYFGFSLQVRRRSAATALRRVTTLKRKIKRVFPNDGRWGTPVLLRDPSDDRYPWTDGRPLARGLDGQGFLWRLAHARGVGVQGLQVLHRCFHGYYHHGTGHWDIASAVDRSRPSDDSDDMWPLLDEDKRLQREVIDAWMTLPQGNQGFFHIILELPYSDILEIDEVGDSVCKAPAVFTTFVAGKAPLTDEWAEAYFQTTGCGGKQQVNYHDRVRLFPDHFRSIAWETAWASGSGAAVPDEPHRLELPDGSLWEPPQE